MHYHFKYRKYCDTIMVTPKCFIVWIPYIINVENNAWGKIQTGHLWLEYQH